MYSLQPRYILIDCDTIKLELEATNGLGWTLHCEVHSWSKEIYQELLNAWISLQDILRSQGITELYIYAHAGMAYKFANMFGFTPTGMYGMTIDNKETPIWRFDLCHQAQ